MRRCSKRSRMCGVWSRCPSALTADSRCPSRWRISARTQFQTLLEKATDDPAAYGSQFKEILDEQTFLKEKRSGILADNSEQAKANQRILDAAQTLENTSPHITEWDESAVRQLVETVKILSKDEIAVTLKGGVEICQKIMY